MSVYKRFRISIAAASPALGVLEWPVAKGGDDLAKQWQVQTSPTGLELLSTSISKSTLGTRDRLAPFYTVLAATGILLPTQSKRMIAGTHGIASISHTTRGFPKEASMTPPKRGERLPPIPWKRPKKPL